jgi:hypothetical protein
VHNKNGEARALQEARGTRVKLLWWLMLAVGAAMVSLSAMQLAQLAAIMERFGGILWSWVLLQHNPGWTAPPLLGLVLLGFALHLFLRAPHRSHSNSDTTPTP